MADMQPKKINRLREAMRYSDRRLAFHRNKVRSHLREFVGKHYGPDGSNNLIPVNHLEQAVSVYLRLLASGTPQTQVRTDHLELRPFAYEFQLALNKTMESIDMAQVNRFAVMGAMFGMGIFKVFVGPGRWVEVAGEEFDVGRYDVKTISMTNWVHDMRAETWDEVEFMGDCYKVTHEALKAGPFEEKVVRQVLKKHEESGDQERQQPLGDHREKKWHPTMKDYVLLWDVYLPQDGLLVTLADDESIKRPLRVVEWYGPKEGPYVTLGFQEVLDKTMPLAPVAVWRGLHDISNRIYRKMANQADRQKTFLGWMGDEADAAAVRDVPDGGSVRMDNPGGSKEFAYGGIHPQTQGASILFGQLFDRQAGNIDALGGLGPMSDTVGQDEMIHQAASTRLADMRDRVVSALRKVARRLAWYIWHDDYMEVPIVKKVDGTDIEIEKTWGETREGRFLDYNMEIDVTSLQRRGPEELANATRRWFLELVLPLLPILQQQGYTFNGAAMLHLVARHSGIKEFDELIVGQNDMPMAQGPGMGQGPHAPAVTHRIQERISRPAVSGRQTQNMMLPLLAGSRPQNPQQASLPQAQGGSPLG